MPKTIAHYLIVNLHYYYYAIIMPTDSVTIITLGIMKRRNFFGLFFFMNLPNASI